jgi:hypothetical protein
MSASPNLLPSQRKDVFEFLRAADLDPSAFEWTTRVSWYSKRRAPAIALQDSGFYFMVDFATSSVGVEYSPGQGAPNVQDSFDHDWSYVRPHLAVWTSRMAEELEVPDLWAELKQRRELYTAAGDEKNNEAFTPSELELVHSALREIRELAASSFELGQDQAAALEQRLDYLEGAARRSGRVDWWNILLSTIFQLVLGAVITSDEGKEALALAGKVLRTVYGSVPELH